MIKRVYSKRLKADTWQINITISGKRYRHSGFRTRKEAEEVISSLRIKARARQYGLPGHIRLVTLGELLASREGDTAYNATVNRRRLVAIFRMFVENVGPSMPVIQTSANHLRKFREELLSRYKPSSVEFQMAGVIGALNAGGIYFEDLQTFKAPRLPKLVITGRSTLVPRAELLTLVNKLREPSGFDKARSGAADVIELLQLTGARAREICRLQAGQIDAERRLVSIYRFKTGTTDVLPMTDSIERLLRNRATFPNYQTLFQVVQTAARNAGLNVSRSGWVLHDIRHTAASVMAEAGVSHSIIAAVLGHRLSGTTATYTHASIAALRHALGVLESYWRGEPRKSLQLVG